MFNYELKKCPSLNKQFWKVDNFVFFIGRDKVLDFKRKFCLKTLLGFENTTT